MNHFRIVQNLKQISIENMSGPLEDELNDQELTAQYDAFEAKVRMI